ncbi:hypothetical protein SISSUDRAFT_1125197 [Sistotremastrum suecicum HHB10207 ss-3]|uniref:Autophagy-related protein 29 n=1 Tax=Sistotremastrum suecicum HHB10207 ss-3 TaxID=1314776 RepID=A0A166HQ00_9AGAM|nr:hypothetical protein SISSUDRAFT_1125197 [Sistotremastrum suecicum HHB10207 ss-3]
MVHLIIRLPYNRPDDAPSDPPQVEWNTEKETILWDVIAKSRATENSALDWQGLSEHLQVPLPYLLYRARNRYMQDLKGLQDIRAPFSPIDDRGNRVTTPKLTAVMKLSSSGRIGTPPGARGRLLSTQLTSSPTAKSKALGSSTLTLKKGRLSSNIRPASPSISNDDSSSDEEAQRAEEAERHRENQDAIGRKLKELEERMTHHNLGLAAKPRFQSPSPSDARLADSRSPQRRDSVAPDTSESAASSPSRSIPSIPSPQSDSVVGQGNLAGRRPLTLSPGRSPVFPSKPSKPLSRYHSLGGVARASEKGSAQGSAVSSFSDLSDISTSALDSGTMSNSRGGSRLSVNPRSHFSSRGR